jgi:hypothetical protein
MRSKHPDVRNFVLTAINTRHMDSRWYISDLYIVTNDTLAFVPSRHQVLYPDTKETDVKCLQLGGD